MDTSRYAVLKNRDFRLALAVRFFDGLAVQMLIVAVGWQIYQLTKDPLLLGVIGLAEAAPYIAVALWAGRAVDRREKSGIIAKAESGMLLTAVGLALLSLSQKPLLWPIYLLIAWGGLCRCFEWTALMSYMQLVVPTEIFPKAAAWNTGVWHAATIAGPVLGGLIYGWLGPAAAYGTIAVSFLVAFFFAQGLRSLPAVESEGKGGLPSPESLLSGLRFVFSKQVILAAMSLDMFGVFFAGVDGVLPIFAVLLGAGPAGLGLLKAAPAVGALLCSFYLAHHMPFKKMGQAFVSAVSAFGLCMIAFAFSKSFAFSLLILGLSGVVDNVSMVIRHSLYQALTPDSLRGRVSAVNGIFIRTSNQIGYFESGLAAKIMGLIPSVIFGGCATLISAVVAAWKAPQLVKFPND